MSKTPRASRATSQESQLDPRLSRVAAAFKTDKTVTMGGKAFGSTGLKTRGKIFAFMSSNGEFVVKLPRARAEQLVAAGDAVAFDPGHGRVMKEWVAVRSSPRAWVAFAKEACEFVGKAVR